MTDSPPPVLADTASIRRRWTKYALIASLAVNALMVGAIARSLWSYRAVALTGGGVETSLPAFVNTLPAERREALRRQGVNETPGLQFRALRAEIRRARIDAARIFVAEPFDKQAFIAAQRRLFDAEQEFRVAVQRNLPEIGASMTAAERRAYLSWRAPYLFRDKRGGGRGRFEGPEGGFGPASDGPGRR